MRTGCKAIFVGAGILVFSSTVLTQSPAPWRTTTIARLSYRDWQGKPCGPGSGRYHHHQFRNNSSATLSFFAAHTYTDGDGQPAKASTYHSLEAGRESASPDSEVCAIPGSVRVDLTLETRRR
jgi:hypothetical protein